MKNKVIHPNTETYVAESSSSLALTLLQSMSDQSTDIEMIMDIIREGASVVQMNFVIIRDPPKQKPDETNY